MLFSDAKASFICIQESKLALLNNFKTQTFLPPPFSSSYVFSPADGSRGGLITSWDPTLFSLTSHQSNPYSLTTTFGSNAFNYDLTITNVYGPADHRLSNLFLQSLCDVRQQISGTWILIGDFNLVRGAADKSNGQFNAALADALNNTILQILVSEIPLSDRRFIWSNKQAFPILARLDRAFTNVALDLAFPMTSLSSLPRPTSDHTPIMLSLSSNIPKPNSFKLDNYLLKNNSFLASVVLGWQQAPACSDAAGKLVACIKAARAAAKVWKRRFRVPPQIIQNYQFIIQLFDYFEENRTLSASEFQVRNKARDKLHEEIKIKAAYWRQRSKEKRIKELDCNTAYHHAQATHRMRKKYIRTVKVGDQEIVSHSGKTEALTAFFSSIIGVPGQATVLDLDEYYADTQTPDSGLTRAFSEIELKQAVMAMNPISAPGEGSRWRTRRGVNSPF
jgi:hypothetical protein